MTPTFVTCAAAEGVPVGVFCRGSTMIHPWSCKHLVPTTSIVKSKRSERNAMTQAIPKPRSRKANESVEAVLSTASWWRRGVREKEASRPADTDSGRRRTRQGAGPQKRRRRCDRAAAAPGPQWRSRASGRGSPHTVPAEGGAKTVACTLRCHTVQCGVVV